MPIGKGWLDNTQDISEDECNIHDLAVDLLKEKLSEIWRKYGENFEKWQKERKNNDS